MQHHNKQEVGANNLSKKAGCRKLRKKSNTLKAGEQDYIEFLLEDSKKMMQQLSKNSTSPKAQELQKQKRIKSRQNNAKDKHFEQNPYQILKLHKMQFPEDKASETLTVNECPYQMPQVSNERASE